MRYLFLILPVLLLASCSAPEQEYCRSKGVTVGSSEFGNCTQHYFEQENAFTHDLRACSVEADRTYPQGLYSGWGRAHVHGGMYGGRWHSAQMIETPPDYQKNALIDSLRSEIIEPCMQARGWNSSLTWEAGRHAVTPAPKGNLPWGRK